MAPKTFFGVITESLTSTHPALDFLANAKKCGHAIDELVVGYTLDADPAVVATLSEQTRVRTVRVGGGDQELRDQLSAAGVTDEEIDVVFVSKTLQRYGKVTYGRYRNTVIAAAMLDGADHLLFFDTDVYPKLLLPDPSSQELPAVRYEEIDFVGRHREFLDRKDVFVTTSDYSGYYILPPMRFDGLEDFLIGIQKEAAYDFLCGSGEHHCLNLASAAQKPSATTKLLGGNLGIDLSSAQRLPPFFSNLLVFGEVPVLGRGEDTLMGSEIVGAGGVCIDIGCWIFHDTFGDFPEVPDVGKQHIRDRLYRGSLGWIARNPFLSWYLKESGRLEGELEEIFERERRHLVLGAAAAAQALGDGRFLGLPDAFDLSVSLLDEVVGRFRRLSAAWSGVMKALSRGRAGA